MTMLSSTMGEYTLKGVWVFLALVGLVVAPASVSRGYGTMCVVEEDTNRVLMQYDVIMFQVLMSRSPISLEQEVSQSWSRISTYEEASTLLKLQRKLEGEDVLQTLVVINTQPELLNNDLIQRALLKVQTTLEEEEELLEMHFGKKTSPSKHVVLTSDAFQSLRTQLQRSASEADEDQTLHSAESSNKLVEVSCQSEPQLQNLLAAYAQARLLDQQLQLMKEMVRKFDGPLDFNSRNEASPISRVVLTKDAFQSLLRQLKLDTTPDEKEDDESSQSLEVEVSGSKLVLSKDQTASPLMLQKEIFSKMVLQTLNALYGQSGFQDQLKMLEGVLDQKSQQRLEKTESPSKLIAPVTFQRQFLSKMVSQTLDALYGQSGFQDQLKMLEGVLDQKSQQSLEKTESPSKLIAPVTIQRQFLSKMVSQTLDALYGQSGFQDQLKMLEGVLDQKSQQSLEKTESPSKLIAPVTIQRQFLSKMVSQTLDALYGQSGFQDQLKMLDGMLDRMKYPREAAFQSFNDLHQDVWLSREATRERTVQGQTSAAQGKSTSLDCKYRETLQAVQLYTDSCYKRSGSLTQRMAGLGGLWQDKITYHVFSAAYSNPHKLHNNDLEMLAIWVALKLYGKGWRGMNVEAYCDNESTVKLLNTYCDDTSLHGNTRTKKQRSSKIQTFIINKINEEVCKYKFSLSTVQIGGKQNCRADMLSRRGIKEFASHLPRAARYCEYDVMAELSSFDQSLENSIKTI